ncbi:MAG: hypothetical protein MJA29_01445 [Candidatus Omnitrophica bacterium]|nr:hypothetical protein [Candidatus Omnitrophota bacterium]
MVRITNVVCFADLGQTVNVKRLPGKMNRHFSCVHWKHSGERVTCTVYKSGKLSLSGATSVKESKRAAKRYVKRLRKLELASHMKDFRPVTMSAVHKLASPIKYIPLVQHFQAEYEPELFHGAGFRRDSVYFTCYSTGTIIVTGIKSIRMLEEVVYPTLIEIELLCG